jgi:hypothetical protein
VNERLQVRIGWWSRGLDMVEVVRGRNGSLDPSGPLFRCSLQTHTLPTMQPTRALRVQPNLLLCLDAFNTLIKPIIPIHVEYARAATSHGIACGGEEKEQLVKAQFKKAFQGESQRNPNYGKATGLGPERWWGNVSCPFQHSNVQLVIETLLVGSKGI